MVQQKPKAAGITKHQLIKVLWLLFCLFFPFQHQTARTSPTPYKVLINSRRMKLLPFQNVCAPYIKNNPNRSVWGAGTHIITPTADTGSKFCQADWGTDFLNSSAPAFSVLKLHLHQMQIFLAN